ncbi:MULTISPECIES: EamA family transporter RarD [Pseudomonas]|uniref:EamA family transporter RarD n=1 Tax=Pseudomonas TaxID=286 RepID=UPI000642796E|nr:EamA family transporter RarD [Pseudomonas lundensis]MBM1186317.1 EamA family transporter RarD [Pseudomonas lundensis]NLT99732.1 EamA family transporter RarD [Pseudomonas lundensis]NNA03096.1 EamA family transporter RarD [Pseudomonas lundensis]NNA05970.1 EamA family transporter RarD [Pseudomonas lundensis]NNA29391.1 EamA family transporter RarD [Pseudomonas lundensis]
MSKGIVLSVLASSLFGVMYYYTSLLYPLSGAEIFGWRMLLTLPCMTVFMCFSGDWRLVPTIVTRLRQHPRLWIALLASSALVGLQLWLFLWAPLNGHSLDVSLGYFLLPLTMILTGRVVYGEHLSHLQKIAAALATFGVANEVYRVGGFSWTTLVVAIGYPLYFVLRKRIGTDNLGGLWMDMLLLMPAAFLFVQTGEHGFDVASQREALYTLIPLLGLISALALISYIMASRMLAFSLFGLLSYVEPVLLVCVALLLGESISAGQWLTYLPIWLAVMVLVFEGFKHMVRQRKSV